MRTSNLLPDECREEIREKIQYELGFNNGHIYGAGSSLVQSEQWVKALQWVLGDDGNVPK